VDAALAAARLRLRPILDDCLCVHLGCVPLWTAAGSGAVFEAKFLERRSIGGMLAATFIAIFLIPVLFYVVERLSKGKGKTRAPKIPRSSTRLAWPRTFKAQELTSSTFPVLR